MPTKPFKFALTQCVRLVQSGEQGIIIGQAHFSYAEDSFLVRYPTIVGELIERWWNVDALELIIE